MAKTTYYYHRKTDDAWVETSQTSFEVLQRAEHDVRLVKVETPRFAMLAFTGQSFDVVAFDLADDGKALNSIAVTGFLSPDGVKPPKELVEAVMLKHELTWFNYKFHATAPIDNYDPANYYEDGDENNKNTPTFSLSDPGESTLSAKCMRCGGAIEISVNGFHLATCPHCGATNWF